MISYQAHGYLVLAQGTSTSRQKLLELLPEHLRERVPGPRSVKHVFREAVTEWARGIEGLPGDHHRLSAVVPVKCAAKGDVIYEVVAAIEQTTAENYYRPIARAVLTAAGEVAEMVGTGVASQSLHDCVAVAQATLSPQQVSDMVVTYLHDCLQAVQLVPGMRVFWVDRLGDLPEINKALRGARGAEQLVFRIQANEDTLRYVTSAITREIAEKVKTIYEELGRGEIGPRAAENRRRRVEMLHRRVERYESMISEGQSALRKLLDDVDKQLAVATMAAM